MSRAIKAGKRISRTVVCDGLLIMRDTFRVDPKEQTGVRVIVDAEGIRLRALGARGDWRFVTWADVYVSATPEWQLAENERRPERPATKPRKPRRTKPVEPSTPTPSTPSDPRQTTIFERLESNTLALIADDLRHEARK